MLITVRASSLFWIECELCLKSLGGIVLRPKLLCANNRLAEYLLVDVYLRRWKRKQQSPIVPL